MTKEGMRTPDEIRKIAWSRINEAECLCQARFLEGAFYLAGYSVELMLKAKICDCFGIPNLFAENGKDTDEQRHLIKISDIRKSVKIHNLYQLLVYSGLKLKFDEDKADDRSLMKAASLLFKDWDENCRYSPIGTIQSKRVTLSLINALKDHDGLLQWIEKN